MTHGRVMNVPATVEVYDALHAQVGRRSAGGVDGGKACGRRDIRLTWR